MKLLVILLLELLPCSHETGLQCKNSDGNDVTCQQVRMLMGDFIGHPGPRFVGITKKETVLYMVNRTNQAQNMFPGYEIVIDHFDTDYNKELGLKRFVASVAPDINKYVMFLGGDSTNAVEISTIAPEYHLPSIGHQRNPKTGDRKLLPGYFNSQILPGRAFRPFWQELIVAAGWKEIAFVRSWVSGAADVVDDGMKDSIVEQLSEQHGVKIHMTEYGRFNIEELRLALRKIRDKKLNIVLFGSGDYDALFCGMVLENMAGLTILGMDFIGMFGNIGNWDNIIPEGNYGEICTADRLALVTQGLLGFAKGASTGDNELTCLPGMSNADLDAWWQTRTAELLKEPMYKSLASSSPEISAELNSWPMPKSFYDEAIYIAHDWLCVALSALKVALDEKKYHIQELYTKNTSTYLDLVNTIQTIKFEGTAGTFEYVTGTPLPVFPCQLRQFRKRSGANLTQYYLHPKQPPIGLPGSTNPDISNVGIMQYIDWSQWPGEQVPKDKWDACGAGEQRLWGECTKCPIGKAWKPPDATQSYASCADCTRGKYASNVGQSACTAALPGTFTSIAGATEPSFCVDGEFSSDYEATSCSKCNSGTYANSRELAENQTGFVECLQCPRGKFANGTGNEECETCQPGETTLEKASVFSNACVCEAGKYRSGRSCVDCPGEGLDCIVGEDLPVTQPGFMMLAEGEIAAYRCLSIHRCPGGMGRGECPNGFGGIACSTCPSGEKDSMGSSDDGCKVCSSFQAGAIAIAWFLVCLIPIHQYYTSNKAVSFGTTNQHVVAGLIAIAASAVQTLGIISSFSVDMQSNVDSVSKGLEFVTLLDLDEVFSTNCSYGRDPLLKYALRCAAFYVMMSMFYAYLLLSKLRPQGKQWEGPLTMNAIATLLGTLCITVFKAAMDPMTCYSHPIGKSSLRKYPEVVCGESTHVMMVFFGLCLLLGALAFLAYVVQVLISFPGQKFFNVQDDQFLKLTRFLHFNYAPRACFWRVVQLIRALCLSLCAVIFPNDVHAQMVACLFVVLIPLMLTIHFRPWRVHLLNELDMLVTVVTIAVLLLVSCFLGKVESPSTYASFYLLMLACICLCFAATILKMLISYSKSGEKFAEWKQDLPGTLFMKGVQSERFARWRQACEDSVAHRSSIQQMRSGKESNESPAHTEQPVEKSKETAAETTAQKADESEDKMKAYVKEVSDLKVSEKNLTASRDSFRKAAHEEGEETHI